MKPKFVPSSGARIAVHTLSDAPADAPVLVLCHALGFCARAYAPLVRVFESRVRCLAIDLRWHGASEPPASSTFEWAHFADDVRSVLASDLVPCGVDVHGFGHSLGGAALALASSESPAAFRSLFFFEPVIPPPEALPGPDAPNRMADMAERRRARFESRASAEQNFATKLPFASFDAAARAGYLDGAFDVEDDGSLTLRCRPEWEAALYRTAAESGAWNAASRVTTPVRVAMGREEANGPSAFTARATRELGAGEPIRLDSLGHLGPLEDPRLVGATVAEWIAASSTR